MPAFTRISAVERLKPKLFRKKCIQSTQVCCSKEIQTQIHCHHSYLYSIIEPLRSWFITLRLETKWLTFYRQHFQIHFTERKFLYFDWNFNEVCSYCLVNNKSSLVQLMAWCQAIIWISDDPVQLCICVSPGFNELMGIVCGMSFHNWPPVLINTT